MQRKSNKLTTAFDEFWFAQTTTESLGVFRVALGLFVLHILLISMPNWERFYGENATVPLWLLRDQGNHYWSVFGWSGSPVFVWSVYALLVAAGICFTLGLFTRAACVVLFVGYSSMVTRNTWMVNGQDQVAVLLLLLGCFAPLGYAYSLDSKRMGLSQTNRLGSVWAQRLMQLSIAIIYLSCGPTKLEHWQNGDALYYTSFSYQWFRFPTVDLFHAPAFSIVGSYATILIESAFPVLVWLPPLRTPMVCLMALFHVLVMILLSPAVFYFNLIMVIAMLLYLDNDVSRNLVRRLFTR